MSILRSDREVDILRRLRRVNAAASELLCWEEVDTPAAITWTLWDAARTAVADLARERGVDPSNLSVRNGADYGVICEYMNQPWRVVVVDNETTTPWVDNDALHTLNNPLFLNLGFGYHNHNVALLP